MKNYKEIQHSLMTTYRKKLWSPFFGAINNYQLIENGDHIAVCVSGGKDSMIMAFLFKELQKHQSIQFDVTYLVMDPGYSSINRELILKNAQRLELDLHIFNTDIFEESSQMKKACYACARKRRGHLYVKAKELGCNKIALGHHYDDALETIVMNMFFKGNISTMMPSLKSKNYEGMSLIRPFILTHEKDIISFSKANELEFLKCACRMSEQHEMNLGDRKKARGILNTLSQIDAEIPDRLYHSMSSVNLEKILKYKIDGKEYSFLD